MTIYTGGSASVSWGVESTFNTAVTATNIFGVQQKISSFSLTNNRIDLNKLGQVETACYAYGQQAGSISIGFIFDNTDSHKIFESIYGAASGGDGTVGTPFLYPATNAQGATSPSVTSLTTLVQLQTGADTLKRSLTGCIVNSLGISTSIGETVNGTVDMSFAKEDNAAVLTSTDTITQQDDVSLDQGAKPYTFAHGVVNISTGGVDAATEVADVQDIDITFAQNAEMLYGIGSNYSVDAFRRVLEVTGRFRAVWRNDNLLQHVIDQIRSSEEVLNYGATSGVGLELTFTNGVNIIKIELNDLGVGDHNVTGIEPVEPVFEEINFKAKHARLTITVGA